MADAAVVAFLNKVASEPSLRTMAKETYTTSGLEGLVKLGEEHGEEFSARALEEVISPSHLETGAAGVSIGWG
jgi:hypothetical protein